MFDSPAQLSEYLSDCVAPVSRVETDLSREHGVHWDMLRCDRLAAGLSGNKSFKLMPYLIRARKVGVSGLLSFGGTFSNHLHALAGAGQQFGFRTVGVVRGYAQQPLSPTLIDAQQMGMTLHFADRNEYTRRYDSAYWQVLQQRYPDMLIIPEGGAAAEGVEGAAALAGVLQRSLDYPADYVALATGTGTSFLGLLSSSVAGLARKVLAVPALSNADEIETKAGAVGSNQAWQVLRGYEFGGFAKMTADLALFIQRFQHQQAIPLDPVYTAKLCYAMDDQIRCGAIPAGSRLVTIHTGGLQGMRGMQDKIERLCGEKLVEVVA